MVLVFTDGEPTAHLEPDGWPVFDYPPDRTVERRRRGDPPDPPPGHHQRVHARRRPRLVAFVDLIARLNGGRVRPRARPPGRLRGQRLPRARRGRR